MIKSLASEGIMFDLTAPSELQFLVKCGGAPEDVVYTSITETASEYESVIKLGVKKIVVASDNGLSNLTDAVAKLDTRAGTASVPGLCPFIRREQTFKRFSGSLRPGIGRGLF